MTIPTKTGKMFYSLAQFYSDIEILAQRIELDQAKGIARFDMVFGIPSGGIPVAMALAARLGLPLTTNLEEDESGICLLIVDDLIDTGRTLEQYTRTCKRPFATATLHRKAWAKVQPRYCANPDSIDWVVYWWEGTEEKSAEDSVIRQLQFIGEDPTREGLLETPARVVRSWSETFAGYRLDPAKVFKVFQDGACDEMVLLKDIEFYSTCEHHMLPFFGKAHIAYIPNGKVIGISKLARLLEIYARRLQIQERLGQQITRALNDNLEPKGSACILEAQHFCMTSRGVQKQNSVMVTSSLTGVFRENTSTRNELLELLKI